jgi:beta-galactosidase GanA
MHSTTSSIVRITRKGDGACLAVHGTPTLLLAGELHNSSASSLPYLAPILDRLAALGLNTVLVPLSWELIEPEEGTYDFTLLDGAVQAARRRGLHLVFLWFGTLKNAISCYTPAWVKTDTARFFRSHAEPGVSSWAISVLCEEALRCDARAFAAVMARLRDLDAAHGTVLMVQVENEPGMLNAPRDRQPLADAAFAQPVPAALLEYLAAHEGSLVEEMAAIWTRQGRRSSGTWTEVFGDDADEVFMGWHVARFLEGVAAAGQAVYDLPLFANAWLIAGPGYGPGQYPSGGPVSKLLDVWQAAAPTIALLAPDIYHPEFRAQCASYARNGNPLFIPEARNSPVAAAQALYAIGRHHAIGYSPFAIDDLAPDHPLGETYRQLSALLPLLTDAYGTDRLTGFLQEADEERWSAEVGGYRFTARTSTPLAEGRVPGAALLLAVGAGEFMILGRNLIFTFEPGQPSLRTAELVWLDTGEMRDGAWVPERRLNGDETAHGTGVLLGPALQLVRFRLHGYR